MYGGILTRAGANSGPVRSFASEIVGVSAALLRRTYGMVGSRLPGRGPDGGVTTPAASLRGAAARRSFGAPGPSGWSPARFVLMGVVLSGAGNNGNAARAPVPARSRCRAP